MVGVIVDDNTVRAFKNDVKPFLDPFKMEDIRTDRRKTHRLSRRQNRQTRIHRDVFTESPHFELSHVFEGEMGVRFIIEEDITDIGNILTRIKTNRIVRQCRHKRVFRIDNTNGCHLNKTAVGVMKFIDVVMVILHVLRLSIGDDGTIRV